MKSFLFAATLTIATATSSLASASTCAQDATERKLAGAAKTSFMARCEKDAKARCDAIATSNKLNGAARTSNVNKCIRDNVGS